MRRIKGLAVAAAFCGTGASAQTFHFECPGMGSCASSNAGGHLLSSSITYDASSQDLTWTSLVGPAGSGCLPSLFWIVLSPGPAPDQLPAGSVSILFADGASGR